MRISLSNIIGRLGYLVQSAIHHAIKTAFLIFFMIVSSTNAEEKSWKISSDSSSLDMINHSYIWKGNAKFISDTVEILGHEIKELRKDDGATREIHINGTPTRFIQKMFSQEVENEQTPLSQELTSLINLQAHNIVFQLSNNSLKASTQVFLKRFHNDNDFFEITGDDISLTQSPIIKFVMRGSPISIAIAQPDQPVLKAMGEKLSYDEKSKVFSIEGNVTLDTGREKISAHQILFDSKSQKIEIPKNENQQVNMTKQDVDEPIDEEQDDD